MTITHFYFDMDNVLTDLDGYLQNRFKVESVDERLYKQWRHIVIEEPDFFLCLPPSPHLEEMKEFMGMMKEHGIIVSTLTSLGGLHHDINIHSQKHKWLEKHEIEIEFLAVNHCYQKQFLAHDKAFLIDDMPSNIEQFTDMGGQGIVYSFDTHAEAMKKLRKLVN